jgi:hypothetical protein
MELVRRLRILSELDHSVLKRQQHPWVDLKGEMEVERSPASLLGVQVDLPRLAQGIRLDEMALVMNVKAVIDGVLLELGHISGDIDHGHGTSGYR